jgi:hypothetical protein
MATRIYLPASGTAPLGSLAVDSQWERSDDLNRRPCGIFKTDTVLTQKSYKWQAAITQQWVWVQFQSKCMAAGYSWTTSDTVSMVVKCAESIPQGDSHLSYVIRVVSQDGATIRGIVGAYLATSTEYPTSLATICTRIHSARTDGAATFTSYAGDRIIIEIGQHGVTPDIDAIVYQNFGDPSATSDYALTAGLTTDLCPWVELSRTVSFAWTSTKSAFTRGAAAATPDHRDAFTQGSFAPQNISDHKDAWLTGVGTIVDHKDAFTKGQVDAVSHKDAWLAGGVILADHKDAYLHGQDSTAGNKPVYTSGQSDASGSKHAWLTGNANVLDNKHVWLTGVGVTEEHKDAFTFGSADVVDYKDSYTSGLSNIVEHKDAYTAGQVDANDTKHAYAQGYTAGTDISDHKDAYLFGVEYTTNTKHAFAIGLDNPLVPNGYIGATGVWFNEVESESNLYLSIDEATPNDSDYIWNIDPEAGDYIEFTLSNPAGTPGDGDVVVFWRGKDASGLSIQQATIQLRQGSSTVIASMSNQTLSATAQTYYFTLSAGERANITDWTDLRIRILPVTA